MIQSTSNQPGIDLSSLSFDEWLGEIFKHPVLDVSAHVEAISAKGYLISNQPLMLEYLIRLFRAPAVLNDYSQGQLEQAFWAFLWNEPPFVEHLWNPEIPLKLREQCIRSMADLYEQFFAINAFGTSPLSPYKWWDLLTINYDPNQGIPVDADDAAIQQVMFDTLCRILTIQTDHCIKAALHGLGHLKHPNAKTAIDAFLETHPELGEELRKYAIECKEGRMQ